MKPKPSNKPKQKPVTKPEVIAPPNPEPQAKPKRPLAAAAPRSARMTVDSSSQPVGIVFAASEADVPSLPIQGSLRTPLQFDGQEARFVLGRYYTTKAFDRTTHEWTDQSITCIPDPLGINGETLIGQRRTERPKAEAKPTPAAEFEESTFKTLFPLFADPRNDWLLSALVEGITNSQILSWIYKQLDSIPDPQRIDNLKKKLLLNPDVPEDILFANCIFCNVKEGQVIDSLGQPGSAISIHNDYPFAPLMHKVFILQQRKHDISQITPEEVLCFYELLYECAVKAKEKLGQTLDGFTYGMNYGLPRIHKGRQVIAAGASQPHLHSQVGALTPMSYNAGDHLGLICRAYRTEHKRDYLADYLAALRRADLVIEEDEHAVLFVPVAQRFNSEIQIMAKSPKIGNILDTTLPVRRSLGRLEHLAYMIYQRPEVDIQSFNTVMHATRFSSANDCGQRLIVSIYPRTTIMALSELAHRNVVDSMPWQSAGFIKGARKDVLTGPRKLSVLVVGAHPDDLELGCGGALSILKAKGHKVNALVVTDGSAGKNRSPRQRENEADAAAKVLGIERVMYGKIRDGQAQGGEAVYNLVTAALDRHSPDIVLCHAHVGSEHLDHKNVSDVVRTVCNRRGLFPLMFEVPAPKYRDDKSFIPRLYFAFGEDTMERKIEAVSEHKSEMGRGTINVEVIRRRGRERAAELGAGSTYAEALSFNGPDEELRKVAQLIPFATSSNS
jgi:LmbE family N-acetylglucosaminyl deacetylase/diadenosine tetraphosphate (Ap4A) HIT family hydrolase